MAEHEELTFGARGIGWRYDAQMIAAIFLRDAMDLQAMFAPLSGDDSATAVGVGFFEAGRFGDYKTAKRVDHLREGWLQEVSDFLRDQGSGHCANMLTMRRPMGNEARDMGLPRASEKAAGGAGEIGGMPWGIASGAQETRPLYVPGRI
jgi:hypothetical protein